MKTHRTETKTVEVVVDTLCDLCGASVHPQDDDLLTGERVHTKLENRIVEFISGEAYCGKTLEVDLCPSCWADKLLPFLRSNGLTRDYLES